MLQTIQASQGHCLFWGHLQWVPDPALPLTVSQRALCFPGVRPCLANPRFQCPKQVPPFLVPVPGLDVPESPRVS